MFRILSTTILLYMAVILVAIGCSHVAQRSKPAPATPSQAPSGNGDQRALGNQSGVSERDQLNNGSNQAAIRTNLHNIGMGWRGDSRVRQSSITGESLLQTIPALQFDSVSLIPDCAIKADTNGPTDNNDYWIAHYNEIASQVSVAGLGGATVDGQQCAFTYAPQPVGYGVP